MTQTDQTDVRSIRDRASTDHKQAYKNDTGAFERNEPMSDGNRNRSTADDSSEARAND